MASEPIQQRSRKGCLTCRQKRKKCDEAKPTCTRCDQTGDQCVWPLARFIPKQPGALAPRSHYPLQAQSLSEPTLSKIRNLYPLPLSKDGATPHNMDTSTAGNDSLRVVPTAYIDSYHSQLYSSLEQARDSFQQRPLQSYAVNQSMKSLIEPWDRCFIGSSPAYTTTGGLAPLGPELDEDEESAFKTTEWVPATNYMIRTIFFDSDSTSLSNALNSYIMFFVRYSYEPTKVPEFASNICTRMGGSASVRLGIMSLANLFQSFIDHSKPPDAFRKRAKELITTASAALQAEMFGAPPSEQLMAMAGIMTYQYYSGDYAEYIKCVDQAVPAMKALIGSAPLKFHELHGPATIEVQIFVWCDVFSSLVLGRPTRLVYDCNPDELLRSNQAGPSTAAATGVEPGPEWIAGLPNALLMLTIQIIDLSHSQYSQAERISQATKIEVALRNWKVWPSRTTNSMMRVQRMSAQEIWRHFVILVLYQVIHKASPDNGIVQQSVKQIVQLASALRPGHNPDCLLYGPYFMAGTFAVSILHRHFIKTRILQCSIDSYSNMLTVALENIWKASNTETHYDWPSGSPPLTVIF